MKRYFLIVTLCLMGSNSLLKAIDGPIIVELGSIHTYTKTAYCSINDIDWGAGSGNQILNKNLNGATASTIVKWNAVGKHTLWFYEECDGEWEDAQIEVTVVDYTPLGNVKAENLTAGFIETDDLKLNKNLRIDVNLGIGRAPRTDGYKLNMGGHLHLNNNNINYVNQLHFYRNVRFYDDYDNDSYLIYKYGDHDAGGIKFYDGNSTLQGYIYCDGTTTPSFGLLDAGGKWAVRIRKNDYVSFGVGGTENMRISSSGNVGIGANAPEQKLDVRGNIQIGGADLILGKYDDRKQGDKTANRALVHGYGYGINDEREKDVLVVNYDTDFEDGVHIYGPVGINTDPDPRYKLGVGGTVIAEGYRCRLRSSGEWPDYVFQEDYNLQSLTEVEGFIKDNSHLPGIPSANEVAEEGIDLGKMNALLLQKIEELTLHMIEQEKRINELENKQ